MRQDCRPPARRRSAGIRRRRRSASASSQRALHFRSHLHGRLTKTVVLYTHGTCAASRARTADLQPTGGQLKSGAGATAPQQARSGRCTSALTFMKGHLQACLRYTHIPHVLHHEPGLQAPSPPAVSWNQTLAPQGVSECPRPVPHYLPLVYRPLYCTHTLAHVLTS